MAAALVAILGLFVVAPGARGGDDKTAKGSAVDVRGVIKRFSAAWPADRKDYRQSDDESWKAYATALRDLVASKDAAAVTKGKGM